MAKTVLRLTLETEAVGDAVDELRRMEEALISRHGAPFRALQRRIDDLFEGPLPDSVVSLVDLGGFRFCAVPAGELAEILAEGRRLKVLA